MQSACIAGLGSIVYVGLFCRVVAMQLFGQVPVINVNANPASPSEAALPCAVAAVAATGDADAAAAPVMVAAADVVQVAPTSTPLIH